MIRNGKWIGLSKDYGSVCPVFEKTFPIDGKVVEAQLYITAAGVYEAHLNGNRVGNFVLAPGCTVYEKRLQYQVYDVTDDLKEDNLLAVAVGTGWYRGRISSQVKALRDTPCAMLCVLRLLFEDGTEKLVISDESWTSAKTGILSSDIYDGEEYDACFVREGKDPVMVLELGMDTLIAQEGEYVTEHERIRPVAELTTPKGERVLDFGQNFAGYPQITIDAPAGTRIELSCAEILDGDGNFYTENYRTAKAKLIYICSEGKQTWHPHFTFYGFRYLRLDCAPEGVGADNFTGIAVYSDMKRTGRLLTGNADINRLYENTLWSQRANFIDIPTDCPQRDERMGWTGDAQVFCKTACFNYDARRFFEKWMHDMGACQLENGSITDIVPNFWNMTKASTAWGDAAAIIPWQVYLMYNDTDILKDSFQTMKKWVDYITADTLEPDLWIEKPEERKLWGKHYGDWLALDAPYGSYKGSTDDDYIASVFYYYSASLLVKTGKIIGEDISEYEKLAAGIKKAIRKRYTKLNTQTEHVLALYFDMTEDRARTAAELAEMIKSGGNRLKTGFVGTPYLLQALSDNGYTSTAYDLLLQTEYPSWLYEVRHGATTIWEHWDGIRDDKTIWSSDMNSYNHYAYGSVFEWVYTAAAGIQADEEEPGFGRVTVAPKPDIRLGFIDASLETAHGTVRSVWYAYGDGVRYEITLPVKGRIIIGDKSFEKEPGTYIFTSGKDGNLKG